MNGKRDFYFQQYPKSKMLLHIRHARWRHVIIYPFEIRGIGLISLQTLWKIRLLLSETFQYLSNSQIQTTVLNFISNSSRGRAFNVVPSHGNFCNIISVTQTSLGYTLYILTNVKVKEEFF